MRRMISSVLAFYDKGVFNPIRRKHESMIWINLVLFMMAAVQPTAGEQHGRRFIIEPLEHTLIQGPATVAFSRDLDGDRIDELVYIRSFPSDGKTRYMLMIEKTSPRETRASMILPAQFHPTVRNALDVNADGTLEITMSYVRDDTVFAAVFDHAARPMAEVPVFTKRDSPKIHLESPPEWIPGIPPEDTLDCNGDRYPELICVGGCGYWAYPRGIWAIDWVHKRVLWHYAAGAKFEDAVTIRDSDGVNRIVAASNSGAGGIPYNKTHPDTSYLAVLSHSGELLRLHVMSDETNTATRIGRIQSPQLPYHLISITSCGDISDPKPARLFLWEGAAERVMTETSIELIDTDIIVSDIDANDYDEFLVMTPAGELGIFGSDMRLIRRISVGTGRMFVADAGDITGDGYPEAVINMRTGIAVIDPRSGEILSQRSDVSPWAIVRFHPDSPASILAKKGEDYSRFSLQPNPEWIRPTSIIFHPGVIAGIGISMVLLFIGIGRRISCPTTFPVDGSAAFAEIRADGKIITMNRRMARLLDTSSGECKKLTLMELLAGYAIKPETAVRSLFEKTGQWIQAELTVHSETKRIRCRLASRPTKTSSALLEIIPDHDKTRPDHGIGWALLAPRVAHNMKSPLSTLLLGTERAVRSAGAGRLGESDSGRILDTILHQVERIDGIARNFLKLAELERSDLTLVNPDDLINKAVNILRERKTKEISVNIELEERLPALRADEEQLLIVFENVFENSIAAIEDEGNITVRAYRTTTIPGREALDGEALVVEVSDTGSGIESGAKDRIFDVGFTTRRQGSGLGLAIIRHIVELHGGVVEIHSEIGIGTTVTVCIPARPGAGS